MKLRVACCLAVLAGLVVWSAPGRAQINMDSGKTPAQVFATTCSACHRSPREIKPSSAAFLREHYMAGRNEAAAMAAYLAAIGSDPNAVKQRPRPAMGVGQPAEQKPALQVSEKNGQARKIRRPSDSLEVGKLSDDDLAQTAAAGGAAGGAVAASPPPPAPPEAFEE